MSDDEEIKDFSQELPKMADTEEVKNKFDQNTSAKDLDAIYDVPVQISAVLGQASIPVNQLLKLGRGAVVELDRKVGESIDIYVNNKLVARGEVMVVGDSLGITMTEIIKSDKSQSHM
jgi:flagellar motor switch protein FliN/FliY